MKRSNKNHKSFIRTHNSFIRTFAILSIYLMISLIFITANALAMLNYQISGDAGINGFAKSGSDDIQINVQADSNNVSFVTGQSTSSYKEIPLTCVQNGYVNNCTYYFQPTDLDPSITTIPFTLQQISGTPATITGNLYMDSFAPIPIHFNVTKMANGLLFNYSVADYLSSTSEQGCQGSGIGQIEIDVQGATVFTQNILTQNCAVSGTYFYNMSGTYSDSIYYSMEVLDRVGNEYNTGQISMGGDFRAPVISGTFHILKNGQELLSFSSAAQVQADVALEIDDTNLNISNIYGDLSSLNNNPAINIPYRNVKATCIADGTNNYICTFNNILIKPSVENLSIAITAVDTDKNIAQQTASDDVNLENSAGTVLYLGPDQNQCTDDLSQCFTKSGRQLFYTQIDGTSDYNNTIINLGIDNTKNFGICTKTDGFTKTEGLTRSSGSSSSNYWNCVSTYNIPVSATSINLFLAESYDNYGNPLISDMERTVTVDDTSPVNITSLDVSNSNNNANCSVNGDELDIKLRVSDASPELRMHVNTSAFTTQDSQNGTCTLGADGNYDCELTITNFISTATRVAQNIIVEDLAGNQLSLPYTFNVCQSSTASVPNVIYSVSQKSYSAVQQYPMIDRRTASLIPVKTYIPIHIDAYGSASLMYLSIDNCVGITNGSLDFMSAGNYFIPSGGTDPTLVLNIGHNNAQLPENSADINCTLSARVQIGSTVFTQDEKKTFTIHINTFNNPLGTIDQTALDTINAQKEKLRNLDDSMRARKTVDRILGTLCDLANIVVKVNSVLQMLKSIMYGVCLALDAIWPVGLPGSSVWKFIAPPLNSFDTFVHNYIWPTQLAWTWGNVIKYSCMIYTCQFYTFQGIASTYFDAKSAEDAAKAQTEAGAVEVGKTYEDVKDENGNVVYTKILNSDGSLAGRIYSITDNGGNKLQEVETYYDGSPNHVQSISKSDGTYTEFDEKGNIINNIVKFKLKDVNPHFIVAYLNSSIGQEFIYREVWGGAQPGFTNEQIRSIPIPVPDIDKQNEIANHINGIRQQAQAIINKTKHDLEDANKEIEFILLN